MFYSCVVSAKVLEIYIRFHNIRLPASKEQMLFNKSKKKVLNLQLKQENVKKANFWA